MADVIQFIFTVMTSYISVLSQYYFTQAILLVALLAMIITIIKYVSRGGSK